ncbi:MAG: helix-turn-helix transcriptional regulator [Bacteroidaceae bacterium]|nr:helix-turn-helix transcriptional regulator [Bacteroidaceae bacterium]
MEKLEVFECADSLIGSYFTDDKGCAHCNREHTLIYLASGKLEITENGKKSVLRPGDCAFMRRDNRMWLQKWVKDGEPYRSVVMKFSRKYLKDYYQHIDSKLPYHIKKEKASLMKFTSESNEFTELFESLLPYFDAGTVIDESSVKAILDKGMQMILHTDANLYASLFDFVDPWKIDIMEFMEKNFTSHLSMEEFAYYTGRSLASFKRDFKKVSDTTPEKWLINRRLEAALKQLREGQRSVSDICFEVGFKNLSHFSRVFKDMYGYAPTLA